MDLIRTYLKQGENTRLTAKEGVNGLLNLLKFCPDLYAVFEIWDRETQGLARGCEAVAIQGTRLVVRVPSTVHRQELIYSKSRILKRLNQAMGRKAITDIQFELSSGESSPPRPQR